MPDTEFLQNTNDPSQRRNFFYLVYFGIISGVLSYFSGYLIPYLDKLSGNTPIVSPTINFLIFLIPGILFGIFISLYFLKYNQNFKGKALLKSIIWIIISGLGYYAAVSVTIGMGPPYHPAFFIGGLVGAFITLLGFRFLIARLSILEIISLTMLGGVLGLSWFMGNFFNHALVESVKDHDPQYFFLFTIWQAGMALGMQFVFKFKPKSNIENVPIKYTITKKSIFSVLVIGFVLATSYLAYSFYSSKSLRSPTQKEKYYGMVATDFNVPEYCYQISPHALYGTAGFSPAGHQISLFRSECFYAVATGLKDPNLCKEVKPISTDVLDGSKVSEESCREGINKGNHNYANFDLIGEELTSLLNQMGYTEKVLYEDKYYENASFTPIYDFYQRIKDNPDFLKKISNLPNYAEQFDNNKIRTANTDEAIIEIVAIDNSQPMLCEKISPNAIYQSKVLNQTHPVRDNCLVSIAFNTQNVALCSKLSKDPTNNQYQYYDGTKACEDNIAAIKKNGNQGLSYGPIMPNLDDLESALNKLGYSSGDIWAGKTSSPTDPEGFYYKIKSSQDPAIKQEFLKRFNQFINSYQ